MNDVDAGYKERANRNLSPPSLGSHEAGVKDRKAPLHLITPVEGDGDQTPRVGLTHYGSPLYSVALTAIVSNDFNHSLFTAVFPWLSAVAPQSWKQEANEEKYEDRNEDRKTSISQHASGDHVFWLILLSF
jgi:hypothetical protein